MKPERVRAYSDKLLDKFLTAPQVDQELRAIHQRLLKAATGRDLEENPYEMVESCEITPASPTDDESFSGPEPKLISTSPPKRKTARAKKP